MLPQQVLAWYFQYVYTWVLEWRCLARLHGAIDTQFETFNLLDSHHQYAQIADSKAFPA